jgi:hypothetical protein
MTPKTGINAILDVGGALLPRRRPCGHTDTVKSLDYSVDLLKRGVYIEHDCTAAVKRMISTDNPRRVLFGG